MQRSPQHHKDMPDKVRPLGVLHKWNHAERIDNTTAHDPSQKRLVISEPAWNEHDGAPIPWVTAFPTSSSTVSFGGSFSSL